MKRLLATILFLSSAVPARAGAEPFVRTTIGTEGKIWTGQKVILVVELLAPGYFAGAPLFDLPKIPGCLITPPVGSPVIDSETRDGETFTVQRHELMVFPHRSGKIDIPPFAARLSFKRQPLDKEAVSQSVVVPAVSFIVTAPPADASRVALTSADLTVSESWSPEPGKQVKTGAAFVRTITWSASDLTGMAFPPFPHDGIPGLGIYHKDPLVKDLSERGQLTGSRVDVITYVCKGGGDFTIPAYQVSWWDPMKMSPREVVFPPRVFTVVVPPPPPESVSHRVARLFRAHGEAVALASSSLAVLLLTLRLWQPVMIRFVRRLRPRHLPPLNPCPSE